MSLTHPVLPLITRPLAPSRERVAFLKRPASYSSPSARWAGPEPTLPWRPLVPALAAGLAGTRRVRGQWLGTQS